MHRPFAAACLLVASVVSAAELPSAEQLLEAMDKNMTFATRRARLVMVVEGRRTRTFEMISFGRGQEDSAMEYLSPSRDKGTRMLKLGGELWLYLPAIDKVQKISGHMLREGMMGSDLSYEDMMSSQELRKAYDAKVTGEETIDGVDCWKVELKAKSDTVSYSRRVTWVAKDTLIAAKQELYALSGMLLKTWTMSEVKEFAGGRRFPTKMVIRDHVKKDSVTRLEFKELEFGIQLETEVFALRWLEGHFGGVGGRGRVRAPMRAINFSAGPAGLPLPALEQARDELLDYRGSGMSIMEQSHRGPVYEAVHQEAKALLTRLLGIPDTHQVLFLGGGASLHFAMVPMNFLPAGKSADYVMTGVWSEKALDEAKLVGTPRVAVSTKGANGRYDRVPTPAEVEVSPDAAYVHSTSNNTIYGTQFHAFPDTGAVPHVCDMSSDFLWRPLDVSKFDLIYAGAQKNLGPSGVVVCVARKEFLARGRKDIPKILRYQTHAENDSLYNTPPTFAIYLVRNVLSWIEAQGGLPAMEARNTAKAQALYGCLDRLSGFYAAPVEKASRSVMNIVFRTPSEALDSQFVAQAEKAGMVGLKGHRTAGGLRVSAYNAVSEADIGALVSFMESFAKSHG